MQVNYMTPHEWSKIKKLEKIIKKGKKMDQIEKTDFYDIASFKKRYFGTPLLLGAISYGIVYLVKNFEVIKK